MAATPPQQSKIYMEPSDFLIFEPFYLFLVDVVPPKITNCPSDIIKKVTTRQAVVSWPKPSFYDAVGVTRIEEPYIPSGSLWTVGESALLQYRISDAAGNIAKCNFRVTVKSMYYVLFFLTN